MQQMTMDGISFSVGESCTIDTLSEIRSDTSSAKLICISDYGAVRLQYIRFHNVGEFPSVVLGSKDDIEFQGILSLVAFHGKELLHPGEKITKITFLERMKRVDHENEEQDTP